MRKAIVGLAVLALLVLGPPAAAAASLSVTPSSVDFGRVPVDSQCQVVNDVPNEFCVTQTLTVTNTGTDTLLFGSASACERITRGGTCLTRRAGWGGFTGSTTSTCIFATLAPGDGCTVVLVADPTRRGLIRGLFIMTMSSTTGEAVTVTVPIRVLGV
jgi:hypothetical protein